MKKWAIAPMIFALALVLQPLGAKPEPAQAAPWLIPLGASFNTPRSDATSENRNLVRIYDAINHAPAGSKITIGTYSFDRMYMADALIKAKQRGVQVRILLNNHQVTNAQRKLHRYLGRDRTKRNFSYECEYSCRDYPGTLRNLHSKMYLFSQTGATHDVVMIGSTNITLNAVHNQWNDLWVGKGPALYKAMLSIWEMMRKDNTQNTKFIEKRIDPTYVIQATPMLTYTKSTDPMMQNLNKVKCFGATGGTGVNGRTKVRVIMHAWNGGRGLYLAQKIRQLYANGCDVSINYGLASSKVRDVFKSATARGLVPACSTGYDTDFDELGEIDLYTHQKELIISGNFGSKTNSSIVITGSSNWSSSGLRGDELIFKIKHRPGLVQAYFANFKFERETKCHGISSYYHRTTSAIDPIMGGAFWEND